jgi:hypothetical protein
MPDKIDLATQTLYAELLDRLRLREAHRSIGDVPGSFVSKTIGTRAYIYFQFSEPGGKTQQIYLGEKSTSLDLVIQDYARDKTEKREFALSIERLSAQIREGGGLTTPHAAARVLGALAQAGVFRAGGVLVGTHAFTILGNLLGRRWENRALMTQDIDVAIPPIALALPRPSAVPAIGDVLERLKMGFLPVPPFNHRHPSVSFRVRGNPLRVDVLTPAKGREAATVYLPHFASGATALPYLDFVMEEAVDGAVVDGGGVSVRVPHPARFALHKWLVSQSRGATEGSRALKDLDQSAQILGVLADERPEDIRRGWEQIRNRGKRWASLAGKGLRRFKTEYPTVYAELAEKVPTLTDNA